MQRRGVTAAVRGVVGRCHADVPLAISGGHAVCEREREQSVDDQEQQQPYLAEHVGLVATGAHFHRHASHIARHRRHPGHRVRRVVDLRRGVERVDVVRVAAGLNGGAGRRAILVDICQRDPPQPATPVREMRATYAIAARR